MKLYFDTNVYNFIAVCNEGRAVRQFLDNSGYTVQASGENLFEIFAIPEPSARMAEISTLATVASSFDPKPQSWLHACEVRREIGRCRPHWLKRIPFTKTVQQLLKGHFQLWKEAKAFGLPPGHTQAYTVYRRDFESGVTEQRRYQKTIRENRLNRKSDLVLLASSKNAVKKVASDSEFHDPEIFWRVDCLMAWYNALVVRSPESRDYADWLDPYVKKDAFKDPTYEQFWLQDVETENVPRNRLISLVAYYQTHHKISHGNATDQIHAGHLLDVDLFFTADRSYYAVLLEIVKQHFADVARPILLERSALSALEELASCLSTV